MTDFGPFFIVLSAGGAMRSAYIYESALRIARETEASGTRVIAILQGPNILLQGDALRRALDGAMPPSAASANAIGLTARSPSPPWNGASADA